MTVSDDLGRVVVPKEIRRTLRIREGDPLQTRLTEIENTSNSDVSEAEQEEQFVSGLLELVERTGLK